MVWRYEQSTGKMYRNGATLPPEPGTQTFGRTAFRIHGDSISNPGTASEGCIILPPNIRIMIIQSGDTDLKVVQ